MGFMSKALMAFNAVLTFYIMNSQDRRFAAVDAEAKAKLDQATQDKWPECPAELATCSKISTVQGLNGPFHKLNITHTPLEHVCVHNMNDNNCVCKCSHFTS